MQYSDQDVKDIKELRGNGMGLFEAKKLIKGDKLRKKIESLENKCHPVWDEEYREIAEVLKEIVKDLYGELNAKD